MSSRGPDAFEFGTAGASARREHERRRTDRRRRVREQHPYLGGIILALQRPPGHEQAWARGAEGEEIVAGALARHLRDDVCVLHDRKVSHGPTNIDHIAVARSGVWVIDAKRYAGRAQVHRPLVGQPKLLIGGHDRDKLVEGLAGQVAVVRSRLKAVDHDVPVHGALCFVDTDLPTFRTLTVREFPLLYPRRLARRINASGPLAGDVVSDVVNVLRATFPSA